MIARVVTAPFNRWAAAVLLSGLLVNSANSSYEVDQELLNHLKDAIEQADSFEDKFDAQVWLMDKSNRMSRFVKDPEQRLSLLCGLTCGCPGYDASHAILEERNWPP